MFQKFALITMMLLAFNPVHAEEFKSKNCPFTVSFPENLGKIKAGKPKSGEAVLGFLKGKYFSVDIACGDNIVHKPIPESAKSEKQRVAGNLRLLDAPQELLNFQFVRAERYALTFHSSLFKGEQEIIFLTVEGFSDSTLFTMVISVLPGAPDSLVDDLQKILKAVKWSDADT